MNSKTYQVEIITPMFCAGADPKVAEIRASSIRGQLRWWFRVLGGFKSLADKDIDLRAQEEEIFGSIREENSKASKLRLRVPSHTSLVAKNIEDFGWGVATNSGYLAFPIRPERDPKTKTIMDDRKRGVFNPCDRFTYTTMFPTVTKIRGKAFDLNNDICALNKIFIEFGSLGSRQRRGFGSMRLIEGNESLTNSHSSLNCFSSPHNISVFKLEKKALNWESSLDFLGGWLKSWSSYGRTGNNSAEQKQPGYDLSKSDHDFAVKPNRFVVGYRAALGLPRMTKYGNWIYSDESDRFASPVILRPTLSAKNEWNLLVIFVDFLKWDASQNAKFRNRNSTLEVKISLDLYEKMKEDPRLGKFS